MVAAFHSSVDSDPVIRPLYGKTLTLVSTTTTDSAMIEPARYTQVARDALQRMDTLL
jgi:hypothetical protein